MQPCWCCLVSSNIIISFVVKQFIHKTRACQFYQIFVVQWEMLINPSFLFGLGPSPQKHIQTGAKSQVELLRLPRPFRGVRKPWFNQRMTIESIMNHNGIAGNDMEHTKGVVNHWIHGFSRAESEFWFKNEVSNQYWTMNMRLKQNWNGRVYTWKTLDWSSVRCRGFLLYNISTAQVGGGSFQR